VVVLAFLAALVVVLAALALAVFRALGLWRQAKRTGGAIGGELASFEERTARAERHMSEFERSSEELEQALDRLRVSQARLRVLVTAVERAQDRIRWIRVFVPR
jgi:exonuclease VII small subunit